ncbi:LysR family transcriptional regulator [Marinobacterium zhoushanense]|uniref:LysR family transcriptional regulator n=1 Tax=Marinobacterium zhoushanense TaxID=1679163 RepID=A0ABQ1K1E9_9GAMM|nr:PACE efflux transporter [Marinobacterium zhoushanense]GGB81919.1 LysR family transcriptional regulator [Marinobacterium zhoushanense]
MVSANRSVVVVSRRERLFHAVLFELLLTLLDIAFISFAYPEQPVESGVLLAVAASAIAVAWNYLFNVQFDWVFGPNRMARGWKLRVWHALAFELSLTLALLPVVVWLMDLAWPEALQLEVQMLLMALVFTLLYNRMFDQLRVWLIGAYPDESEVSR